MSGLSFRLVRGTTVAIRARRRSHPPARKRRDANEPEAQAARAGGARSQGRDEHARGGCEAQLCDRLPREVGGREGPIAQLRVRGASLAAARNLATPQLRGGSAPDMFDNIQAQSAAGAERCGNVDLTLRVKLCVPGPGAEADAARRLPHVSRRAAGGVPPPALVS